MKILKIIGHPFTVILSFCLLLISGESVGGFYITYILMALPHASLHTVLAIIGIIFCVLAGICYENSFGEQNYLGA